MKKVQRRPRGRTNSPGIVRKAILQFLLLTPSGSASEPDIRDFLKEDQDVSDPKTVRTHLATLRDKRFVDVNRREGMANEWFVTDLLEVPEFVFSEYTGDDLVEIYRAPFFQKHVKDWYVQLRRIANDPGHLVEVQGTDPVEHEASTLPLEEEISPSVVDLWVDATEVSPTQFCYLGSTFSHGGPGVLMSMMMVMGRRMRRGGPRKKRLEDLLRNPDEAALALVIANLLIDFHDDESLRPEILDFLKREKFQQQFHELFPEVTIDVISDTLWSLSPFEEPESDEKLDEFDLMTPKPVGIQPPP